MRSPSCANIGPAWGCPESRAVTAYDIAISEDRGRFPASRNDKLLRAALRAGIGFPYECNSGSCGSCKFELLSGELELPADLLSQDTERDRSRKRYLACRVSARSDCRIKVRTQSSYVPKHRPARSVVGLVERLQITHDMVEFAFRGPASADFLPGQYAMLAVDDDGPQRAYSMANIANPFREWRFIIKRVPGGALSERLFDLRIGDPVWLDGPYGLAYARTELSRDVVCIAGGAGLSPMLSIARGLSASGVLRDKSMRFYYGCREPHDIPHDRIFADLPEGLGALERVMAVSQSDASKLAGWSGPCGMIHDIVDRDFSPDWSDREFYISGPPKMVDATVRLLALTKQVSTEQIHFDRFF